MAVSTQFKAFIGEHLTGLGAISTRHMFGGAGVYCRGVMFALIADDVLYMKVSEAMKAELAPLGCGPFMVDFGKGDEPRPMNGYWEIPQSAMDDPGEACEWGQGALDFALSQQSKKKR